MHTSTLMHEGLDDGKSEGRGEGRRAENADDHRAARGTAGAPQDRGSRGAHGRLGAARPGCRGLLEGAQGGPAMKIIERVTYGKRGEGSLVRYEGVATW